MEPPSPEGNILNHLRTIQLGRTQALYIPYFCPRVPNLSSQSPWVLHCRVLSGAVVQIFRSLHHGAGLGLNTLNMTRFLRLRSLRPALLGNLWGRKKSPRGRGLSGLGTEGRIRFPTETRGRMFQAEGTKCVCMRSVRGLVQLMV